MIRRNIQDFNVNQYWLERGRTYIRENLPAEFHRLQERFLLEMLQASRVPLDRILEIGCGFGRITRLLAETFPQAQITALDLSPDQLENAGRYCGHRPNISFQQYDLYSGAPFPSVDYDAGIAIEVLLHHPPQVVRGVIEKLATAARHLVNIDWSEEWPWETPEHVWVHDYRAAYREAGLQCATFVLPEKVEGLQHKLFIAARQLSPALLDLERETGAAQRRTHDSDLGALAVPSEQALPEAASWPRRLRLAVEEIRETIPANATFILVNDDQWGNESRALEGYRVFPFLERDGQYWGPPADDETALRELERLRQSGASHIVFAWPSFWWLEHYAGLRRHLDTVCAVVRQSERLKIFRL